jgi:hypothetical protein
MSVFRVTTSDGRERSFRKLETAERWAKQIVADSASDQFAISADIDAWGIVEERVRLDGNNRVWIDEVWRVMP